MCVMRTSEVSTFLDSLALQLTVVELKTFFVEYNLLKATPQRSELNTVVCNDLGKGLLSWIQRACRRKLRKHLRI